MSAGRPDYYAVLGVDSGVADATIRQAYRALAARWHPDRHPGDDAASARFKALVEAYSVLGDQARRRAYDEGHLAAALPIERRGGLTEAVGEVVDRLFGVGDKRPRDGRNRVYRLTVPFAAAMRGSTQRLALPHARPCEPCGGRGFAPGVIPEICPRCLGFGQVLARPLLRAARITCQTCDGRGHISPRACSACDGRGEVEGRRAVSIELPPGLDDGASLRVRGGGEAGRFGGADGDLMVEVHVAPHRHLRRVGQDITVKRPVPLFVAAVGGPLAVPTIHGSRAISVPPGSADGDVLLMPGFGVPASGGREAGDQRVTLALEMPQGLDGEAAATLRGLMARLTPETFPQTKRFEDAHE
ncbi:MAG: hypothetical protein CSA24_02145 [Deltaproteobacteria bacterium]|nr:MAG: hypothetical protein CSA24_02145 [Deltaproteobacteria bacterium]